MTPERKINPVAASIIVIVLVVGITVGILVLQRMNSADSTTTTTENTTQGTTNTSPTSGTYKDGTYTETGAYSTPGGREDITITLTLADNKVTNITAEGSATRGDSAQYQEEFLSGYKVYVEGKDVDTISLSRVSGSSLTSDGFNKALEAIKVDAQA
jgi:uncharacterized protein with FMN-binding domain